jgi:hypothetical protein
MSTHRNTLQTRTIKKTRPRGKDCPPGIIIKKRPHKIPAEKIPEHWPLITSGAVTAHSATAQPKGGAQDVTRERVRHIEGIFLNKPEIHPRRGSNPRPEGVTWKP